MPVLDAVARRTTLRAGYQGEPGAYSEEALLALFPAAEPVGHRTFTMAVDARVQSSFANPDCSL